MSEVNSEKINLQKEALNRTLLTMFDYLGLKGDLRIEEKNGKLLVKIASDDAGRIIGRKGQILESLQLLANRILFMDEGIIKEQGTPSEVFDNPKDARLRDFLSKVL